MLVLQDATGAVALYPESQEIPVKAGQRVSLKATECAPYVTSLPDFPFRPSGRDVRATKSGRSPTTSSHISSTASDSSSPSALTQSIRGITRKVSESHPVSFVCHVDERQ